MAAVQRSLTWKWKKVRRSLEGLYYCNALFEYSIFTLSPDLSRFKSTNNKPQLYHIDIHIHHIDISIKLELKVLINCFREQIRYNVKIPYVRNFTVELFRDLR